MKKLFNYIMVIGAVLYISACAKPEEPTMSQMAPGEWDIEEVYVNGEIDNSSGYSAVSLFLERNDTFLFVERSGRSFAGTWAIDDAGSTLTLTATTGEVLTFNIIAMRFDHIHMVRTVTSPLAGDIELRYVLSRVNTF
ncbi:hypothetical protein QWY31_01590 [Cytophagales bacterium LB-30]|uniref:Lipocalin-like domain-containing protein n=1 Tax=Shiella aurantiaca TaxID=3058365 RepID=A0ABT8F157_9BACT|nr:hypothetical protein [Shiella aurantiaca]MDN4164170.1 hypothetical protein [Shiella aurantiaca]